MVEIVYLKTNYCSSHTHIQIKNGFEKHLGGFSSSENNNLLLNNDINLPFGRRRKRQENVEKIFFRLYVQ